MIRRLPVSDYAGFFLLLLLFLRLLYIWKIPCVLLLLADCTQSTLTCRNEAARYLIDPCSRLNASSTGSFYRDACVLEGERAERRKTPREAITSSWMPDAWLLCRLVTISSRPSSITSTSVAVQLFFSPSPTVFCVVAVCRAAWRVGLLLHILACNRRLYNVPVGDEQKIPSQRVKHRATETLFLSVPQSPKWHRRRRRPMKERRRRSPRGTHRTSNRDDVYPCSLVGSIR